LIAPQCQKTHRRHLEYCYDPLLELQQARMT
jgi:hypothetical protein